MNDCCTFLEFIFCVLLNTIHRYGMFNIRREHLVRIYELFYGIENNWTKKIQNSKNKSVWNLIFFGPHNGRYISPNIIKNIIIRVRKSPNLIICL